MRGSFILYTEQKELIDMLTDAEAGKLLKAIFEYEVNDKVIELSYTLKLIFIPIKQTLDRNKKKYENVVERNRLNGLKGGRPKKPNGLNDNPENPSALFGNPNKPKKADNDSDNDNDNDSDIEEEDNTILCHFKKIGIFCGDIKLLDSIPAAKEEVLLYQDVVRELHINKNTKILNNLNIDVLSEVYEKMKGKAIDNPVGYFIATLIDENYK